MQIKIKIIISIILIQIIKNIKEGIFFPKKNKLLIFSDLTYEEALKEYQYVLISAYAEWCIKCQSIEEELQKISEYFENNYESPEIVFGIIYGSYNYDYMKRFNIQGYPSLSLFSGNNKISDYNDLYKTEFIITWIRKIILPSIQPIYDQITFNYLLLQTHINKVIAYFGNDKNIIKELELSNLSHKKFTFCQVLNKDIYNKYNVSENDIILFKSDDELNYTLKYPFNYEKLEKFIYKYSHKLIKPLYYHNIKRHFSKKKNLLLFISKFLNRQQEKKVIPNYEKICKQIRDKIQCVSSLYDKRDIDKLRKYVPTQGNPLRSQRRNEQEYELERQKADLIINLYDSLKINEINQTEVCLIDLSDNDIYVYNIEYNEYKIIDFVNKWYNNNLINETKIKIDNFIKNYVILSNQNKFNNDVINNEFNVIVKFFAPWCGFCKKLNPIYESLAKYYKDKKKKIKFIEIDSTKNEINGINIDSYPTIYFFQKNNKNNPIIYIGENSYNELMKFIDNNMRN